MSDLGRVARGLVALALSVMSLPYLPGAWVAIGTESTTGRWSNDFDQVNPAGRYCDTVLAVALMFFDGGSMVDDDACVHWFPGAENTGADTNVVPSSIGEVTIDGAVLENLAFRQQLTISADNVVLRNVRITTPTFYGVLISGKNVILEDVTVVGTPGHTSVGVAVNGAGTFSARRVDVSLCEDGVRLGHESELIDSYIHDLEGTASSHYDAVGAEGAVGWVIRHNTIINFHPQTSAVTFGLGASDGLLANNLVGGGGYTLYAGPELGTGVRVLDNRFSTTRFPEGGRWGPVAYWSEEGNTWAGNTWLDGPRERGDVLP